MSPPTPSSLRSSEKQLKRSTFQEHERRNLRSPSDDEKKNTDTVPPTTPFAAENFCRKCGGTGKLNGSPCPDCHGSGKVVTPVGDAG